MSTMRIAWGLLVSVGLWSGGAAQAEVALPDLVPADAALYVEIQGLDTAWSAMLRSPIGQRWQASRLRNAWLASDAGRQWEVINTQIDMVTGQRLEQRIRSVFANSVALVILVPNDGQPEGLLLSRGESPAAVRSTVDFWNQLEGDVTVHPHPVGKLEYFERRPGEAGKPTLFYAQQDDLFVLSDRDYLVRGVLQRLQNAEEYQRDRLSAQSHFQQAWPKQAAAGIGLAYLSPRQWDRTLEQTQDGSPGSRAFLEAWKSTQSLLVRASVQPTGFSAELTAYFPESGTSDAWKSVAAPTGSAPLSALKVAPADALVVVGGRIDPVPIVAGLKSIMSTKDRENWDRGMRMAQTVMLGQDPWSDIGRRLLGDWSLSLVQRPTDQQQPRRLHPYVGIWQSRFTADDSTKKMVAGLENGISTGLSLLLVAAESQTNALPLEMNRPIPTEPGVQDWILTGRAEGELAIRLSPERFLVTTSAAELNVVGAQPAAGTESPLARTASKHFPHATAFAWWQVRQWRPSAENGWLSPLAPIYSAAPQSEPGLNTLVEMFDELYLSVSCQSDRLGIQAGAVARP